MFRVRWQISWRSSQASQLGHFLGQGAGHHQEAFLSGSEKLTHFCLWPQAKYSSIHYLMLSLLGAIGGQEGREWEEVAESKFEPKAWCFSMQAALAFSLR